MSNSVKELLNELFVKGKSIGGNEPTDKPDDFDDKVEEHQEDIQTQAAAEKEKKEEDLEGTDLLTKDMVPMSEFLEFKKSVESYIQVSLKFFQNYPTKDEMNTQISSETSDRLATLLSQIKSKTEAPRPSQNFEEVISAEDVNKENWDYAQSKLKEVEDKLN